MNRDAVLEKVAGLPISTWTYKTEEGEHRHIGPMAQDFMATFQVGSSDRTILPVDADGVALSAIQALYQRVLRVEEENRALAKGGRPLTVDPLICRARPQSKQSSRAL